MKYTVLKTWKIIPSKMPEACKTKFLIKMVAVRSFHITLTGLVAILLISWKTDSNPVTSSYIIC